MITSAEAIPLARPILPESKKLMANVSIEPMMRQLSAFINACGAPRLYKEIHGVPCFLKARGSLIYRKIETCAASEAHGNMARTPRIIALSQILS